MGNISNLPGNPNVSYTVDGNTWSGGPGLLTKSIDGKPIYDKSGRTVEAVEWTFVVEDVIASTPPATIDAQIENLRAIFSRNGGAFKYEGSKGFGDFSINTANAGSKDIAFGPKVRMKLFHAGQSYYARVQLEFIVTLPPCSSAVPKGVMSATFTLDFENTRGWTTRTFNGLIKIALVPVGRRLADNADNYREQFTPDCPKGFRRTKPGRFTINEAKNELKITVVDEEIRSENIYPPGCTHAKFSYATGNAGAMNFCRQEATARATYTLAKGVDYGLALFYFKRDCDKFFLQPMRKALGNANVRENQKPGLLGTVLPMGTHIDWPDLYDEPIISIEMRAAYLTSATLFFVGPDNMVLPDSNEDLWKQSMKVPLSARGYAGLGLDNDSDIIYDLCTRFQGGVLKNKKRVVPVKNPAAKAILGATWPLPHPNNSWLDIQLGYHLEPKDNVMRHMPLESGESRLKTPALLKADAFASLSALTRGSDPPIFQTRAASELTLVFTGMAVRAGWPIPVPTIRSFGGRATIPANGPGYGFMHVEMPLVAPVPIYFARWQMRFFLSEDGFRLDGGWQSNPKANQPPPPVPQLNFNGLGFAGGPAAGGGQQNGNREWTDLFGSGGVSGLGIL